MGRAPLFWRVLALNAVVLVVACVVTVAVLATGSASRVAPDEAAILAGALVLMFAVNAVLLRRALAPLARLGRLLRSVDPLRTGRRVPVPGGSRETAELAEAYNEMLSRLEDERRESARRALGAQERERLRVAQELHDQVGQTLTAVLLQLARLRKRVPAELAGEVGEAGEAARASLEDVRRIAQELRPEALDDLGLGSALEALCRRLSDQTGVRIACDVPAELPQLGQERDLVVYRVAQEALTNVVRHAGARTAWVALERRGDRVALLVRDDGAGTEGLREGGGIRGMRERAALVGAELAIGPRGGGAAGTEVRLDVPLGEDGLWYR